MSQTINTTLRAPEGGGGNPATVRYSASDCRPDEQNGQETQYADECRQNDVAPAAALLHAPRSRRRSARPSPAASSRLHHRRAASSAGPTRSRASRTATTARATRCGSGRSRFTATTISAGNHHQDGVAHRHGPGKIPRVSKVPLAVPAVFLDDHDPQVEIARPQAERDREQNRGRRRDRNPVRRPPTRRLGRDDIHGEALLEGCRKPSRAWNFAYSARSMRHWTRRRIAPTVSSTRGELW